MSSFGLFGCKHRPKTKFPGNSGKIFPISGRSGEPSLAILCLRIIGRFGVGIRNDPFFDRNAGSLNLFCRQHWWLSTHLRRGCATFHMDRKTQLRARDKFWRQDNAAELNDSCSDCFDTGPRGACHCTAVRPFCLPRNICSGAESGTQGACDALALSARTTGKRYEAVLRRQLQTLPQFAKSLPIEITLEFGAGLESRLRLSDRYQRQKLRGIRLPSFGRNPNFFRSNRSKWVAHGVLTHVLRVSFRGLRR